MLIFNKINFFLLTTNSYFDPTLLTVHRLTNTTLWFYFFSVLCIFFSAYCVSSKNIIHVLFCLILIFLLSSGILFCINVEFLAVIFVMVYVGAILILFLFAIMLLNFRIDTRFSNDFSVFLCFCSTCLLYFNLYPLINHIEENYLASAFVWNIDFLYLTSFCIYDFLIFQDLYTKYSLLLILMALILLVVMIGSVSICLSSKIQCQRKLYI